VLTVAVGAIIVISAQSHLGYPPIPPGPPPFVGYSSNTTRLDSKINLTQITLNLKTTPYKVTSRNYVDEWHEGFRISERVYMSNRSLDALLVIDYSQERNMTLFYYIFPGGHSNANSWLMEKIASYMEIPREDVERHLQNTTYRDDGTETYAAGEPNWATIRKDLGDLERTDSSGIGFTSELYSPEAEITYSIPSIIIEYQSILSSGTPMTLSVYLDAEGDIAFQIRVAEKIQEPENQFLQILESAGIPSSVLEKLPLKEEYAGYV